MKYFITESGGTYTCTIPLQLKDGRVCLIQGKASVSEVAGELGFSYDEFAQVGGIFGSIGKFFKKVAKSKAVRKAVGMTKSILKSPITTAALGVVTGGSSVPFTAAANAALRLADAAKKGGKKGKRAKKLMKATLRQAKKESARKKAAAKAMRRGKYPRSAMRKTHLSEKQYKAKIKRLKGALKGRRLKRLSKTQKQRIAKLLKPYTHELRFA